MSVFDSESYRDHEFVSFCQDSETGLKAIIGVHDSTLGPALGGCRMWPFVSEQEALEDVLRLSRGMTYKAAMADLSYGGGKAVIIGDSRTQKTPELFRRFGRFVDSLHGAYITAEDVGTSPVDMEYVREVTDHVAGYTQGGSGDPSPATAWGVFHGIRAAANAAFGTADLTGKHVAVQGLGHVGYWLVKYLHEAGAQLTVTDIFPDRVREIADEFKATAVAPDEIYAVDADIFAPCALGAIVNDETMPLIKAKVIAGAANNQLKEDRHGDMLRQRGILYAPDYVINAGGIINIRYEGPQYNKQAAFDHCARIYDTLSHLFTEADRAAEPTNIAADRLAEEKLAVAKRKKSKPALRRVG